MGCPMDPVAVRPSLAQQPGNAVPRDGVWPHERDPGPSACGEFYSDVPSFDSFGQSSFPQPAPGCIPPTSCASGCLSWPSSGPGKSLPAGAGQTDARTAKPIWLQTRGPWVGGRMDPGWWTAPQGVGFFRAPFLCRSVGNSNTNALAFARMPDIALNAKTWLGVGLADAAITRLPKNYLFAFFGVRSSESEVP